MRRILVTGGAGFIGSNLIRQWLAERQDDAIVNLDALSYSGNLENLADVENDPRYSFVYGDVADEALVGRLMESSDAVIHLAAESHVDRSITDPRPFLQTNVVGTQVLLECWQRGPGGDGKPFVYVSSDEVYGSLTLDAPSRRFRETDPVQPTSVYAVSKAAGDLLVRSYHLTHNLHVVTTRCSNNFGPYQFPEKIIPLFVTNLLEGRRVPLYGDGRHVRDWIHVLDHCDGIRAALDHGLPGEVYNFGAENERANVELAESILSQMGMNRSWIEFVPDRPAHDRRYAMDTSKARTELGWSPRRSAWPDALADTIDWYRRNERWWKRVRSGAFREYYQRQYGTSTSGVQVHD